MQLVAVALLAAPIAGMEIVKAAPFATIVISKELERTLADMSICQMVNDFIFPPSTFVVSQYKNQGK